MYKKIICLLLFMGCDYFNKPKIIIDNTSSNFTKTIFNLLDNYVIDQFDIGYNSADNCAENLILKNVDACISSVQFSDQDSINFEKKGLIPKEILLGADGIIAVVHNSNNVELLKEAQLKSIFTGDIQFWDEVGGFSPQIITFIQNNSVGELFKELVLNGEDFFDFSIPVENIDSMIVRISEEYNGIGFVSASSLFKIIMKIKLISITYPADKNIVIPLYKNILSGEYPFSHQFYLQSIQNNNQKLDPILNILSSDSTKMIIRKSGYLTSPI